MSEELNFRVRCYLASWDRNLPLEGGLAYAEELRGYQLDYSVDSLKRINVFLDALHARLVPAGASFDHSTFFDGQPNVNLLYFLAFYVGEVAARATGTPARWATFADSVKRMPATAAFGEGFHSSVLLEEPGLFFPSCRAWPKARWTRACISAQGSSCRKAAPNTLTTCLCRRCHR
jgi:hypothetical protein